MKQGNGQLSGKEKYFQQMRETWKHVLAYMKEALLEIKKNYPDVAISIENNYVVKKRLGNNPKLRPYLLRLSFEACRGGDWKRIIPVCASLEFLNTSTYILNAVFDEKGEETRKKDVIQYLIIGMLFRELATKCLQEVKISLSPQEIHEINKKLSQISMLIYIGQHLDLYQLKKEKIGKLENFDNMKRLYQKRVKLICGHFFKNIACIGATLASATFEEKTALGRYGFKLGEGIQIVNDLGDFVVNKKVIDYEKTYQDQFSDIKHGKLTLPVILGLEMSGENIMKQLLGKKKASDGELLALGWFMKTNRIVDDVRTLTKKKSRFCKKELKKLPSSDARDMLSIMASVLISNKYFVYFRELEVNG